MRENKKEGMRRKGGGEWRRESEIYLLVTRRVQESDFSVRALLREGFEHGNHGSEPNSSANQHGGGLGIEVEEEVAEWWRYINVHANLKEK